MLKEILYCFVALKDTKILPLSIIWHVKNNWILIMFLTATVLTLEVLMSIPLIFAVYFTVNKSTAACLVSIVTYTEKCIVTYIKKWIGTYMRMLMNPYGLIGTLMKMKRSIGTYIPTRVLPLPPGPFCFPIVGYLPRLRGDYHLELTRLANLYGPVYNFSLAGKRAVVVSDYTLIREAFKKPEFSGRPDTELTKLIGGRGVINAEGPVWREQRAFLHSVLKDFGATNAKHADSPLERSIKREVNGFLEYLHQTSCQAVNARVSLARSVSNIIGSILMSVTYENSDDGGFIRLHNLIDEGFKLLTVGVYVNFIPILKHVPYINSSFKKIEQNLKETSKYFKSIADDHYRTLDEGNIRDFVDAFYVKKKQLAEQNKESYFSEEQLWQVMGDIFSAGLETVTSTLEWALIFLIRNPEVQGKVFEEIERVVGTSRDPEFSDLPEMPYLEATILEVQRRGNVIALGNTHATTEDAVLGGYTIPKGTHVIPNLWAIHMNPDLWEEPEAFKPERFIVDNKVVKPPYFMPFSVGRRMCVGDNLSKMEIFHFLANIIQKFHLTVPTDEIGPELEGVSNISLQPKTFKMCAIPRVYDA